MTMLNANRRNININIGFECISVLIVTKTNPNFDQMYYNYVAKAFPNFINHNQLSLDDELIEERKSTVYTALKHNLFSNYMYLLSLIDAKSFEIVSSNCNNCCSIIL